MFENVGEKIKGLAKFLRWMGIIGSLIMAFIMFVNAQGSYRQEDYYIMLMWVWLIGGTLVSWFNSLFMYGFGELIERAQEIAKNTQVVHSKQMVTESSAENNISNEK